MHFAPVPLSLSLSLSLSLNSFFKSEGLLQDMVDIGLAKYCHIASYLLPNAMRH